MGHCPFKVFNMRVAGNLEYENLENGDLESILISKKNDWNLEFNLKKVNLENMVGNLLF